MSSCRVYIIHSTSHGSYCGLVGVAMASGNDMIVFVAVANNTHGPYELLSV